jgi:hypothetical protein
MRTGFARHAQTDLHFGTGRYEIDERVSAAIASLRTVTPFSGRARNPGIDCKKA